MLFLLLGKRTIFTAFGFAEDFRQTSTPVQRFSLLTGHLKKKAMKISSTFLIVITLTGLACRKADGNHGGNRVEIYQFKSSTVIAGNCNIDSSRADLRNEPLIANDEIVWYDKDEHTWTVDEVAVKKLRELRDNEPLAMTVGKKLIFYLINKPGYSSFACLSQITITSYGDNQLHMSPPSFSTGSSIPDQRNDARLLLALSAQGKLR
jgi:hypothetical protein